MVNQSKFLGKTLTISVILLFIGVGIQPVIADIVKESQIPLSKGNTLYVGGIGEGNYTYIQNAINDATPGDTVYVYNDSSPYYETVIIQKSINLIGENKESTCIDAQGYSNTVYISSYDVNISGFTIRRAGWQSADIRIKNCYNITIFDNIIISYQWDGISITNSHCNTIIDNDISSRDGRTMYLSDSNRNIIIGNTINPTDGHGIWGLSNDNIITDNIVDGGVLRIGSRNTITGNIISNGGLSVHSENTIIGNTISNSEDGINLVEKNTVTNNTISNCDYGIYLLVSNFNHISGNIITSNNNGIYLESSFLNTFKENEISDNNIGIYLIACMSNFIIKNNFIENSRHVLFENYIMPYGSRWMNNYWDQPRSLPKFILGKIIFGQLGIPWFNIDWRPAKMPYDI